jgi:hypothetical protein
MKSVRESGRINQGKNAQMISAVSMETLNKILVLLLSPLCIYLCIIEDDIYHTYQVTFDLLLTIHIQLISF